jgi:hypothetical protein
MNTLSLVACAPTFYFRCLLSPESILIIYQQPQSQSQATLTIPYYYSPSLNTNHHSLVSTGNCYPSNITSRPTYPSGSSRKQYICNHECKMKENRREDVSHQLLEQSLTRLSSSCHILAPLFSEFGSGEKTRRGGGESRGFMEGGLIRVESCAAVENIELR